MRELRSVPEGLAEMPPGPELATVLAELDRGTVPSGQVRAVASAWYRQNAHDRAQFLSWVVESGLREPDDEHGIVRMSAPDEFSSDEIRAALVFTHTAAGTIFDRGYALETRLTPVQAAMLAGWCDEPRARVFVDWTAELSQAHTDLICAKLLPAVRVGRCRS